MRLAVVGPVLAILGLAGLLAPARSQAPGEPISRSPLGGPGAQGNEFRLAFPAGRLVSLHVNVGRWRLPIDVVKGLKVAAEDAKGNRLEQQAGPCDGTWQSTVAVPAGTELVGISGRHGQVVDSVRFHFSDGSRSPLFGGAGGDDGYYLVLRREGGAYRGSVRGLHGKATGNSLTGIGLLMGARGEVPAELAPPGAGRDLALTIRGEVVPEFAPVVGRLATLYYQCYPALLERFEHPKRPAPRQITLVLKGGLNVPAYCSGAEITVSTDWLRRNPDDVALLTHELTHAVQAYPVGEPGWLVEGLADYARQKYGPKEQPGWALPARLAARQTYKDSYRVAARFLGWLESRHPGVLDQVHRRLQDREFSLDDFRTFTGKSVDTLWRECVSDLNKD